MGIKPAGRQSAKRRVAFENTHSESVKKKAGATKKVGAAGRHRPRSSFDHLPKAGPRFIEPMKPRLLLEPPTIGEWLYEIKFDGIRALAIKIGAKVSLLSRNKNELGGRFGEITQAVARLRVKECVLDGEIVALDEKGRSAFQLLQSLEMGGRKSPVFYYVFDLLQVEGRSLLNVPLHERKQRLAQVLQGAPEPIRTSSDIGADARSLLAQVKRIGLEGIIGKLRDSVYESGRRSGAWIKLKVLNEQEFVIGGYTPPAGARKYFGALLVGYYQKAGDGKSTLRFAGKVGTGFSSKGLSVLYRQFQNEKRSDCPFVDLLSRTGGGAQGLSPGQLKKCTWLNPVFVAQIKFAEWTRDGKLRQPVFLGLRDDKPAKQVIRES
jgi:bifunctional non-homologous end joining protein LigD